MSALVLDASAALTWCFRDENAAFGERLLDMVSEAGAAVPALWHTEVSNVWLSSLKRGRLAEDELPFLADMFDRLPLHTDATPYERVRRDVLQLAREQRLSVYDATYLDLAMRRRLPLATLDLDLQRAARATGVSLIEL
jgi:predicted nucleic acid-binding protein